MTFDELLRILVERKGSDLHLIAGLHPAIRIHGKLVPLEDKARLTPESAKELIYSVLTPHQKNCNDTAAPYLHERTSHETIKAARR